MTTQKLHQMIEQNIRMHLIDSKIYYNGESEGYEEQYKIVKENKEFYIKIQKLTTIHPYKIEKYIEDNCKKQFYVHKEDVAFRHILDMILEE